MKARILVLAAVAVVGLVAFLDPRQEKKKKMKSDDIEKGEDNANEVLRQEVMNSDKLDDYFNGMMAEISKEEMADYVISHSKVDTLVDELDLEHVRCCSECGRPMTEGFCIENGAEYYCSEECLHKHISEEEYQSLYDDGNGESYWTSWTD
jgi:hypothetical protein